MVGAGRCGARKCLRVRARRRIVDHIRRLIWPGYRDRPRRVLVRRRCRRVGWRPRRNTWRLGRSWLLSEGCRCTQSTDPFVTSRTGGSGASGAQSCGRVLDLKGRLRCRGGGERSFRLSGGARRETALRMVLLLKQRHVHEKSFYGRNCIGHFSHNIQQRPHRLTQKQKSILVCIFA
jgi:hypothetical protein